MSTSQVYDLNYMKKVHPRQTSHVLWRSPPAKWLNKTGQSKPNRPLGAPCAPWRMNKCMVGGRRCIWATQNLHTHTMVHTLDFGGFVKPSALYSSASGGCLIIGCQQQEKCLLKRRLFHFAHYFFLIYLFLGHDTRQVPVRYPLKEKKVGWVFTLANALRSGVFLKESALEWSSRPVISGTCQP
jgi:hypothetical protein